MYLFSESGKGDDNTGEVHVLGLADLGVVHGLAVDPTRESEAEMVRIRITNLSDDEGEITISDEDLLTDLNAGRKILVGAGEVGGISLDLGGSRTRK